MKSQHLLRTRTREAKDVVVHTGWCEHGGGFFLEIKEVVEGAARATRDGLLFASAQLPSRRAHPRVFDFFLEVLDSFGIKLPATMLSELILDGQGGIGEKRVEWTPEGVAQRGG
jgi:hypothetical protein